MVPNVHLECDCQGRCGRFVEAPFTTVWEVYFLHPMPGFIAEGCKTGPPPDATFAGRVPGVGAFYNNGVQTNNVSPFIAVPFPRGNRLPSLEEVSP